jgi:hypothetical protein
MPVDFSKYNGPIFNFRRIKPDNRRDKQYWEAYVAGKLPKPLQDEEEEFDKWLKEHENIYDFPPYLLSRTANQNVPRFTPFPTNTQQVKTSESSKGKTYDRSASQHGTSGRNQRAGSSSFRSSSITALEAVKKALASPNGVIFKRSRENEGKRITLTSEVDPKTKKTVYNVDVLSRNTLIERFSLPDFFKKLGIDYPYANTTFKPDPTKTASPKRNSEPSRSPQATPFKEAGSREPEAPLNTKARLDALGLHVRSTNTAYGPSHQLVHSQTGALYGPEFGMGKDRFLHKQTKARTFSERQDKSRPAISSFYRKTPLDFSKYTKFHGVSHPLSGPGHYYPGQINLIKPYLAELHATFEDIRKHGLDKGLTSDDLYKITGLNPNLQGSYAALRTILAGAHNPGIIDSDAAFAKNIEDVFEHHMPKGNHGIGGKENKGMAHLSKHPRLEPMEEGGYLPSPLLSLLRGTGSIEAAKEAAENYFKNYKESVYLSDLDRRVKKSEKRHYERRLNAVLKGIEQEDLQKGEEGYKDIHQNAQTESVAKRILQYLRRGDTPKEQRRRRKHADPESFWYSDDPLGNQNQMPREEFIDVEQFDPSKVRQPKLREHVFGETPQEEKEVEDYNRYAREAYDKELSDVISRWNMMSGHNEKIAAKRMAFQKQRGTMLAERNYQENLKRQRRILKNKENEYNQALYEEKRNKKTLGAHDFWNAFSNRSGNAFNQNQLLGGISQSIAKSNEALKNWRT